MLKSEFQKWHVKEMKREEALKEVEDNVSHAWSSEILPLTITIRLTIVIGTVIYIQVSLELTKCWEKWVKKCDRIVANFEDNLKKEMASRGRPSSCLSHTKVLIVYCINTA